MNWRLLALVTFCSAMWCAMAEANQEDCRIFDGTQYLAKSATFASSTQPIPIFYVRGIWSGPIDEMPQQNLVAERVIRLKGSANLVLDLEHWPTVGSSEVVTASVAKYVQLLKWSKEYLPGTRIGYYGTVPIVDYWRAISDPKGAKYREWQAQNDDLKLIADAADVTFPAAYTFYDDVEGWKRAARAAVSEARRLAPSKPAYLFLWPEYHSSSPKKNQFLPAQMWRDEISFACDVADGVVIWGGWDLQQGRARIWDDNAPWWRETLSFIQLRRIRVE